MLAARPLERRLGVDVEPFEVIYTSTGKKRRKTRNVVGVLCPTVLALRLGLARPIFVDLGDVRVDWTTSQTAGFAAMFDDTPNVC